MLSIKECFNSPYGTSYFGEYAETIPGATTDALSKVSIAPLSSLFSSQPSQAASDNNVWVVGGSLPERDGDKLYNTCPVFSPSGEMVAKHRKIHLFDIDIPGKIRFVESETLSPGTALTTFTTDFAWAILTLCILFTFPRVTGSAASASATTCASPS